MPLLKFSGTGFDLMVIKLGIVSGRSLVRNQLLSLRFFFLLLLTTHWPLVDCVVFDERNYSEAGSVLRKAPGAKDFILHGVNSASTSFSLKFYEILLTIISDSGILMYLNNLHTIMYV